MSFLTQGVALGFHVVPLRGGKPTDFRPLKYYKSEGFAIVAPAGGYNFANGGYALGCFYWVFAVLVPEMWVMTRAGARGYILTSLRDWFVVVSKPDFGRLEISGVRCLVLQRWGFASLNPSHPARQV